LTKYGLPTAYACLKGEKSVNTFAQKTGFRLQMQQVDRSQVRKLLLKEIIFSSKEIIYFILKFQMKLSKNFDFCLSDRPLREGCQGNFDFCLSNCPLKESYQRNFNFCLSNCPLKESYRRNFDFCLPN